MKNNDTDQKNLRQSKPFDLLLNEIAPEEAMRIAASGRRAWWAAWCWGFWFGVAALLVVEALLDYGARHWRWLNGLVTALVVACVLAAQPARAQGLPVATNSADLSLTKAIGVMLLAVAVVEAGRYVWHQWQSGITNLNKISTTNRLKEELGALMQAHPGAVPVACASDLPAAEAGAELALARVGGGLELVVPGGDWWIYSRQPDGPEELVGLKCGVPPGRLAVDAAAACRLYYLRRCQ